PAWHAPPLPARGGGGVPRAPAAGGLPGAPGPRPLVNHHPRPVFARRGPAGADGPRLVEDRHDDQHAHAARACAPATTMATWLPPRATACTSARPSPASVAAVATQPAPRPQRRPPGRPTPRSAARTTPQAPSTRP